MQAYGISRLSLGRRRLRAASPPPLNDDTGIAQVLIAVDQVDLPEADLPAGAVAHEAGTAPAGEETGSIHPELADEEVRAHHAHAALIGSEYLDVRDHAHRARFRRL